MTGTYVIKRSQNGELLASRFEGFGIGGVCVLNPYAGVVPGIQEAY